MQRAQQYRKKANSPRFSSIGSAICAAVETWKQANKSEIYCLTKQLRQTVTLTFYNRRKVPVTDIQVTEIDNLVTSLTSTFTLRLQRRFEVTENGFVRKVEIMLEQE